MLRKKIWRGWFKNLKVLAWNLRWREKKRKEMVVNTKSEVCLTHALSFRAGGVKNFQKSSRKEVFDEQMTLHVLPTRWCVNGRRHKVCFKKLKYKNVRVNFLLTKKNHDENAKIPLDNIFVNLESMGN